jgi:histidine ammonia-lyase
MNQILLLTGTDLKISDIVNIINDDNIQVDIHPEAINRVKKSREFLDSQSSTQVIYGINTGFGPMAGHVIGKKQLKDLQRNLIISHAVGIGNPIPSKYVLAAMVVRLNTLLKGYSGVSIELLEQLRLLINKRIIAVVPEHGAVGTSGDLVQLAHIAITLIGEGDVFVNGEIRKTSEIFIENNISPYVLKPKEGLALINGTSMMAGIAAVLCDDAETLLKLAIHSGTWALEMVNGFSDSLSEVLHSLRPHNGQVAVAKKMRDILKSSKLLQDRMEFNKNHTVNETVYQVAREVQDVYSLRCTPQILGPIVDALEHTKSIVVTEINSVTDNPIIDNKNEQFIHGGNFHGDYIAYAIDQLKMTIVKLTMLSERRINYFLNQKLNKRFPPFINLDTPGLTLGLQAFQFVATSTTSQSQTLAFPQYVHSISTNADNQDVVSMGTDATLLTAKVIENAYIVLTIELITLAQAVDYMRNIENVSEKNKFIYQKLRSVFPAITKDRVVIDELKEITKHIKDIGNIL